MKKIIGLIALSFTTLANSTTVFTVSEGTAKTIYDNYHVEAKFDGAYTTIKTSQGLFQCTERAPWGGTPTYWCDFGQQLHLVADTAQIIYQAMQVEGTHDGAYHTRKETSGKLICTQTTPWGGSDQYNCSLSN